MEYVRRGWRGVLWLPEGAKGPPPRGYTGATGIFPSPADVFSWTEQHPAGNVALRLDMGVVGFDVDQYGKKRGADELAKLEEAHGPLPPTVVSTSRDLPSGVRLYRTRRASDWPGSLSPAIEVIQYGHRYMVVWPSIHPDTGAQYRWHDERTGELADRPPSIDDLAWLPEAWEVGISANTPAAKAAVDDEEAHAWLNLLPDGPRCQRIAEALTKFDDTLRTGGRHPAALQASGQLVRLGERGHPGAGQALAEARERFVQAATAPSEGQRTEQQAQAEWWKLVVGAVGIVKADPTDRADIGCTCTPSFDDRVDVAPPDLAQAEAILARYPDVDWHEVWNAGLDEPEWLIDGFLETRRGVAMFAAGGKGKSLLSLEAAACIATGTPFAGRTTRRRHVLYVDVENDLGDIIDRLKTFGFTPGQLDGWLHYKSFPSLPDLDRPDGGRALLCLAQAHDAEVVIIDTLARTVGGPENDSDTYRAYAKATGKLLKAAGIACLRIDHAGKDAAAGQRGSSAKNDDVDVVWELSRQGDDAWTLKTGTSKLKKRSRHGDSTIELKRGPDDRLAERHTVATERTAVDIEDDVVRKVVEALDRLGVDPKCGRRKARTALKGKGFQTPGDLVLTEAVRLRKERCQAGVGVEAASTGASTGTEHAEIAEQHRTSTGPHHEPGGTEAGAVQAEWEPPSGSRTHLPTAPPPFATCAACGSTADVAPQLDGVPKCPRHRTDDWPSQAVSA